MDKPISELHNSERINLAEINSSFKELNDQNLEFISGGFSRLKQDSSGGCYYPGGGSRGIGGPPSGSYGASYCQKF